jgi:hypothetical protein
MGRTRLATIGKESFSSGELSVDQLMNRSPSLTFSSRFVDFILKLELTLCVGLHRPVTCRLSRGQPGAVQNTLARGR